MVASSCYSAAALGRLLSSAPAVGADEKIERLRALGHAMVPAMLLEARWMSLHDSAFYQAQTADSAWRKLPRWQKIFSPRMAVRAWLANKATKTVLNDHRRIESALKIALKVYAGAAMRVLGFELPALLRPGADKAKWEAQFSSDREIDGKTAELREMVQREIRGPSKMHADRAASVKDLLGSPMAEQFFMNLLVLDAVIEFAEQSRQESVVQANAGGALAEPCRALSQDLFEALRKLQHQRGAMLGLKTNLFNASVHHMADSNDTLSRSVQAANAQMSAAVAAFFTALSSR